MFLKNVAKFTEMHLHRSLFSTCNLQLHGKRDAGIYSFLWVLRNFLGTLLLWKTSCSSQWLRLCIFYQVKEVISCKCSIQGLWESSKEHFSTEATVLKCIPSNSFLEICRSFRTTSEKLAQENYVLAYHTADKDQAKIV